MTAVPTRTFLPPATNRWMRLRRRQGWLMIVIVLLLILFFWRFSQLPKFGGFELRTITAGAMVTAFLAMGQAVIIIAGGIDLSIGATMVVANCLSASWMKGQTTAACFLIALAVVAIGAAIGAIIGTTIEFSQVPDIVVTLAYSFVLSGAALLVLGQPGGGTSKGFRNIIAGGLSQPLPSILWTAAFLLLLWFPIKRSKLGVELYAVGGNRPAAYLAGVAVRRVRILAYTLGGLFAGMAGVIDTAYTGSGDPRSNIGLAATLASVAAAVLGGVALTGGVGGLLGPVLAAVSLGLIPAIMLGHGLDPNLAQVVQGCVIILVVMIGALMAMKRRTT